MSGNGTVRLERVVGHVLRVGALTSTALLLAGLLIALARPAAPAGSTLMRAGLVILIATPVARVVVSVYEYAAERDWLFLALTTSVLVILLGGLLFALR